MDHDFITTCNWTQTGTFTLQAFRGSNTNVVTSYKLFYRKKGDANWTETTNGQVNITSTGEWEIANDWNKSGNDVLTHSYYGITAIDRCTNVYFNEAGLGTTIGNCFLIFCWRNCSSLTSMPFGFNLPTGITSVGSDFLTNCWEGCTSLTSMPSGFNLPSGLTSVGSNFLYGCWYNCTNLKQDAYTEDIVFEFNSNYTFGGTCPITPDSITGASKESPVKVAVNRQLQAKTTLALQSTFLAVATPTLVSPTDEGTGTSPVTFVWKIPTGANNRPVHAHIQIDKTSDDFGDLEKDLYSYKDAGFEYYNGTDWVAYPITGVTSDYYGNQARITLNLTTGWKYWRVRGGVALS